MPEDVKISILESMCPVEIERHLQLNRSRLDSFEHVWEELRLYLEARQGIMITHEGVNDPDAMDVGALTKGGKAKGKNKGKKERQEQRKQRKKGNKGKNKGSTRSGQGSGRETRSSLERLLDAEERIQRQRIWQWQRKEPEGRQRQER